MKTNAVSFKNWLSLLLLTGTQAQGNTAITAEFNPQVCDSSRQLYLDSSNYRCSACADGQEIDKSIGPDSKGNYFFCKCKIGYFLAYNDCSSDKSGFCISNSCTSCTTLGPNYSSSKDNKKCLSCDGTSGLGPSGECLCPSDASGITMYLTENALTKSCSVCPAGTAVIVTSQTIGGQFYPGDSYSCQSCPDPLMSFSIADGILSCPCPAGYTRVGNGLIGPLSCVISSQAAPFLTIEKQASSVAYPSTGVVLDSIVFQHHFVKSATKCTYFGGAQNLADCQTLANLCALQLFDDSTSACSTYLAILLSRTAKEYSIASWGHALPWIYYGAGGAVATSICRDTTFNRRLNLRKDFLNYFVGQFSLNGTFLGVFPIGTLFSYCRRQAPLSSEGGGEGTSTSWQFFANVQILDFQCDLNLLLEQEQFFYELYVYNKKSDSNYPVPVRIVGMKSGGVSVNKLEPTDPLCDPQDVLVRRFFLFDILSGLSTTSPQVPVVVRYAANITLTSQIRPTTSNLMFSPILTIKYAEKKPSSFDIEDDLNYPPNPSGFYRFSAQYTMDPTDFNGKLLTCFIIATVLSGLIFILRMSNWNKRNTRVVSSVHLSTDLGGINMMVILQACLLAMHSWNLILFAFVTIVSWYWFLFFKVQHFVYVLLPPLGNIYSSSSFYFSFTVMIHILTIFQGIYVGVAIYRQCVADIFFIDWEPGRVKGNNESKVSVWRTILVANKWVELTCSRRINIAFTLFWIGFCLFYFKLENLATSQPDRMNLSPGPLNPILRFAVSTLLWMCFTYPQWLFKYLLALRYIGERPEVAFIDLCTVAKVSVIVLDEKYHGYYLHCRSPHAYADGTMAELVEMLQKEEAGLTTDRSLEGAPKDVESFEIFVTGEWRDSFDKIYSALPPKPNVQEIIRQGRLRTGPRGGIKLSPIQAPEKSLRAVRELTMFLKEFVENNFGKASLKRTVQDNISYMERMFRIPPLLTSLDQPSIFFPDRKYKYVETCLLGLESDLILFDIMVYSLCDVWFGSTALSILLTFLIDSSLQMIRHLVGKAVIPKKTMLDGRFII